ncbi:hypothetical protein GGG16DRAFT_99719 [Schizophyllum commune]
MPSNARVRERLSPADREKLKNPDISAFWASLGNIGYKQPVTLRDFLATLELSPKGLVCITTDSDFANRDLQFAHIFARAASPGKVQLAEEFLGLMHGQLYVHTPRNVCFLTASIHFAYDDFSAFLCPTKETLTRMLYAVTHKGIPPDTELPTDHEKNEKGFAHYRYAFPDGEYEYTFTPILGEGAWCETPIIRYPDGDVAVHYPPFEGANALPKVTLHLQPYFVVIHAYHALLLKHPDLPVPRHLAEEADLIRQIGVILDKRYDIFYRKIDKDSARNFLRDRWKAFKACISGRFLRSGRVRPVFELMTGDLDEVRSAPTKLS